MKAENFIGNFLLSEVVVFLAVMFALGITAVLDEDNEISSKTANRLYRIFGVTLLILFSLALICFIIWIWI